MFRNFRSVPRGDIFKFTRYFRFVKSAPARFIRTMHRISIEEFPSHQHTSFGVARLAQSASRTQLRRGFLLVAPRVRARHTAIPPPRGKMNLTGPSHPRQIVSGNWLCPGSRDPKPWNQRTTAVVPHPHGAARSLRCLPPQRPGLNPAGAGPGAGAAACTEPAHRALTQAPARGSATLALPATATATTGL